MRFSDMMGSGAEPPPEPGEPAESAKSDAVADALAPYLSTPEPGEQPAAVPDEVASAGHAPARARGPGGRGSAAPRRLRRPGRSPTTCCPGAAEARSSDARLLVPVADAPDGDDARRSRGITLDLGVAGA